MRRNQERYSKERRLYGNIWLLWKKISFVVEFLKLAPPQLLLSANLTNTSTFFLSFNYILSDFNPYSTGSDPNPIMVSASDFDALQLPDRCSPTSRTPRIGPSRLSSSRRSQSHSSSWFRRKRSKMFLAFIALLASFIFVNWFMLFRLQYQHHAPHHIPKPTLRSSSASLSLQVCAVLYYYTQ